MPSRTLTQGALAPKTLETRDLDHPRRHGTKKEEGRKPSERFTTEYTCGLCTEMRQSLWNLTLSNGNVMPSISAQFTPVDCVILAW